MKRGYLLLSEAAFISAMGQRFLRREPYRVLTSGLYNILSLPG